MKFFLSSVFLFFLFSYLIAQKKDEVSFSKDIFPIIKSKCMKCHEWDDENPSDYAMDNLELLKKSGRTKNIIIPGDGANSYIIKKLLPNPPKGAQMPIFSKKKLPKEEVDLIKRWIDQGAKDN